MPPVFGSFGIDLLEDERGILAANICAACARRFGLSAREPIPGRVFDDTSGCPDVCPTCAQCLAEWASAFDGTGSLQA